MNSKKKADAFEGLPPSERLMRMVQALGDDALLDLAELAAAFRVGRSSAAKIGNTIDPVQPLPAVRRWRWGTVKKHIRELEEEPAT